MLTIHDRRKKKEGLKCHRRSLQGTRMIFRCWQNSKVRSVEDLVFRKFPYVYPYCRQVPHNEGQCKIVIGTSASVDHASLALVRSQNAPKQPNGLDEWQKMFQEIYPRSADERGRSTVGLLKELGELAEAIRVFEKYPKYFVGEAADIFSYLMGIANEHQLRLRQEDKEFSFEQEFLKRYPGLCPQCGFGVCACPPILVRQSAGWRRSFSDTWADEALFVSEPVAF